MQLWGGYIYRCVGVVRVGVGRIGKGDDQFLKELVHNKLLKPGLHGYHLPVVPVIKSTNVL